MDDVLGAVARVDFAGEEDEPMSHNRVPSDGVQLRVRRCGRRDHRLAECSDSEKLRQESACDLFGKSFRSKQLLRGASLNGDKIVQGRQDSIVESQVHISIHLP